MDTNNIVDIAPFGIMLAAVVGALVGYLRLRSEGVFVKPSVILELQQRANESDRRAEELSNSLDEEKRQRRKLWEELASAQYNFNTSQRRMDEMETEQDRLKKDLKVKDDYIQELLAGIEKLVAQIIRHDSSPEWRPHDKGKSKK
jgi:septal ring factor EnvC (AmiA/AmiB activator)